MIHGVTLFNGAQPKEIVMRVTRLFLVIGMMLLVTVSGAFATGKRSHSGARVRQPHTLKEFVLGVQDIQCDIYCDGIDHQLTQTTHPGTVSGCLADCEEICGGPCELV
jgi:hypothetical protein